MKRSYSTDLSDEEWGCLQIHAPAPNKRGRPKTHTTREILNAIFYVSKSGCPWRLLPKDLERPGRPSTGGLADGAWMGPSSGSTPLCASVRQRLRSRLGRNPYLARESSPTPSPLRASGWAANRGDTTATRRFEAASATYS